MTTTKQTPTRDSPPSSCPSSFSAPSCTIWSPPCSCEHCGERIQALNSRLHYLESRVNSLWYLADSLERMYRLVTPPRPAFRESARPGRPPLTTTTTVPADRVEDIYELARLTKKLGDEIGELWSDSAWSAFTAGSSPLSDHPSPSPSPPHTPIHPKRKREEVVRSTFSWEEDSEHIHDHIRPEKRSRRDSRLK